MSELRLRHVRDLLPVSELISIVSVEFGPTLELYVRVEVIPYR
jgi:hypothetical protein